jgi:uncharacterized membrane protein
MGGEPLSARTDEGGVTPRLLAAGALNALLFLCLDAVWLGLVGPRLYAPALGPLLAKTPALAPAALFYLIYLLAAARLCVAPGLALGQVRRAAIDGAVFGAGAYAAYDLTNQATLKSWSTTVTVCDLLWGAFATAAAASATVFVLRRKGALL